MADAGDGGPGGRASEHAVSMRRRFWDHQLPATRPDRELRRLISTRFLRPVTPYDLAITDSFDNVYPVYLRGLAYLRLKEGNLA